MTSSNTAWRVRRKAVWGPKRTCVGALLLAFALPVTSYAAGRHLRPSVAAKPGVAGSKANHAKLDHETT